MKPILYSIVALVFFASCSQTGNSVNNESIHIDKPFVQDYSIKYNSPDTSVVYHRIYSDRNGVIKILSNKGLQQLQAGAILYPGSIVIDSTYRSLNKKNITAIGLYQQQFVFSDDKAVLSNAWAGKLYTPHALPGATVISGAEDFAFLLSDGNKIQYVKDQEQIWEGKAENGRILDIRYDPSQKLFYILTTHSVETFSPADKALKTGYKADSLTAFTLSNKNAELVIGTSNGYLVVDAKTFAVKGEKQVKLPSTDITAVAELNGKLWFGSGKGAFMLKDDGKYNYYASKRWLPNDQVKQITAGPDESVLVLTKGGVAKICFKNMTLEEKAVYYNRQVRERHIRNGFNATLTGMQPGDLHTGFMEDSDNDGLWTSMYLGAEAFRYAVTRSPEALQNCRESLDAMERLYSVNPVKGFPARSFERKGFALHDKDKWIAAPHPEWEWKSTTSSDEAIGHIFVFGVMAELIDDADIRNRSIALIDSLMQHIVDNDFYMIDWDGKPTLWAKWNPEYVNARPKMVGDRKINASNIMAMLQTAYHFTKKEIYKEKAFELMEKHGYFENLMRPMKEIAQAPEDADDWSKMLSESWNHSDDEMYFLGYWGLYRYAFNDTLKEHYKKAIIDHWEIERPEKDGLWNIATALVNPKEFDLKEAIWYLQEYPLDMIAWTVKNSERKDIELVEPNFREQSTKEVLPPDELRIARHNANRFRLDGGYNGTEELSAGDIWLLPYWMGRYLGVISAPVAK